MLLCPLSYPHHEEILHAFVHKTRLPKARVMELLIEYLKKDYQFALRAIKDFRLYANTMDTSTILGQNAAASRENKTCPNSIFEQDVQRSHKGVVKILTKLQNPAGTCTTRSVHDVLHVHTP